MSLQRDGGHGVLRIADDGVGIDTATQPLATARGLLSMRERARTLGGEFSSRGQTGRGTIVEVRMPIEKEGACRASASPASGVQLYVSP